MASARLATCSFARMLLMWAFTVATVMTMASGEMCPWLLDSLTGMVRALENGGTLPWKYRGTAYEKAIVPDGVTTEFVRCPDPTESGIVVKITRTVLQE